jgi:ABC-type nitrate/sulfonate/bicarbonate transport system substrate-binding protein
MMRWTDLCRGLRTILPLSVLAAACAAPSAPSAPSPPAAGGGSAAPGAAASSAAAPAATMPPARMKLIAAYGSLTTTQLPIWVTKEQGYFEKYGLDVELSYIDGSAGVRALASGDAPVSSVGGALVPSRLAGADVTAIAELAPRLAYGVYAAP